MDIFITRYGFQTLMDIVIIDPTHTDMMQWILMTITHVVMMIVMKKIQSYTKQAPGDDFIPLVIRVDAH